jgi:branched-chain amino acid transport system permease protein
MIVHLLNGLVYGGLLYLLAVGLVLIFGLRQVVNFAHGALFMLGAYIGYTAAGLFGYWIGMATAVVSLAIIGVLLDAGIFRPLQRQNPMMTVLVTFGILLVLEDIVKRIWGKDYITVQPPAMLAGNAHWLGIEYPVYRLLVIGLSVLVVIALSTWLRSSRIGLYVRASSHDRVSTAMQGVNTDRVSATVVGIGAALAGLSGVIASPLLALSPSMGSYILIESFIVVVVGGLGSFTGAFVAAMLIGQIQNLGILYLPWAASTIPFLLMIAVLIWRPGGLAGGKA